MSNNKVIGIQKSSSKSYDYNLGIYLKYPINEFLNDENLFHKNSNILITLKINKGDINKNIYFLDNTNDEYNENEESNNHDNLKELNEIKYSIIY